MQKKKLETNLHVQKRLREEESIQANDLNKLIKRAVKPSQPKS